MTHKLMLGAALTALMLSGPLAQAANTAPNSSSSPPAADTQTKPASEAKSAPASTTDQPQFVMSQKPDQWLASNFKGTDVIGPDNKSIGDISDILFDKSGKIEAYVVSVGGFLGVGAKEVAIAPASFTVVPGAKGGADKLQLSTNEKELKQAENFKPYEPPRPPTTTGSAAGGLHSPLGGGMAGGKHPSPSH
jgi:PRC-barrel domain